MISSPFESRGKNSLENSHTKKNQGSQLFLENSERKVKDLNFSLENSEEKSRVLSTFLGKFSLVHYKPLSLCFLASTGGVQSKEERWSGL